MLTESFHGSVSSQCDLSISVGTRSPLFKRFMSYLYNSILLKGNVCIIEKQMTIFVIIPIRSFRAKACSPLLYSLGPTPHFSIPLTNTKICNTLRGKKKRSFLFLNCWTWTRGYKIGCIYYSAIKKNINK